jgi:hypothetical protein
LLEDEFEQSDTEEIPTKKYGGVSAGADIEESKGYPG